LPTSTRFAVSVHLLALLVRRAGRPMRSEEIAADVGTNPVVIRALLSRLSAAGLTFSQRGSGGGAVLAKAAGEIRLLDAYLAVEDREIFNFHRSPRDEGQTIGQQVKTCLAGPLLRARKAMELELASVTIQDIADDIDRLEQNSPEGAR
jgi:Rrf2 family protein